MVTFLNLRIINRIMIQTQKINSKISKSKRIGLGDLSKFTADQYFQGLFNLTDVKSVKN